jgi:hypothetical protein
MEGGHMRGEWASPEETNRNLFNERTDASDAWIGGIWRREFKVE